MWKSGEYNRTKWISILFLTSAILTFQQPPKNKSPLFIGISKFF